MSASQGLAELTASQAPILVADPDAGQREFVRRVLGQGGFRTESVATGREALTAAFEAQPQVVVLEVRLGEISGYEVCRTLRETYGDEIAIIFLSGDRKEPSDRVAGLLIGADDYLGKPVAGDEFLARVRSLMRRAPARQRSAQGGREDLTPRELEVLQLLAEGLDQGEIARRLFITPKTVGKHIEHILSKLPARSRAEAVAIAYRRGLHSSPSPSQRRVA